MSGPQAVQNVNMFNQAYGSAAASMQDPYINSIFGQQFAIDPYAPLLFGGASGERYMDSLMGSASVSFSRFETGDIAVQDVENLRPLARTLNEMRIFGKRYLENDRIKDIFNKRNDTTPSGQNKLLALYQVYCAEYGGLKNPNDPGF